MNEIKMITEALQSGEVQAGYDAGKIKKWAKTFQELKNPRVVKLYPVRDTRYDDSLYRTFAFSLDGKDIDEQLLTQIKEVMSQVEIGDIRMTLYSLLDLTTIFWRKEPANTLPMDAVKVR